MKNKLAILTILLYLCSCGKKCEEGGVTNHLFDLPFSIAPVQQYYNVGDTIVIESTFSDNIPNPHYGKPFKVEDFDFKTNMRLVNLQSETMPAISYKSPNIITLSGNTIYNNILTVDYLDINIQHSYTSGTYQYRSLFIVDKPGKYIFFITSDHNGSNRTDVNLTECISETIEIKFNTNDRQDNNYSMLSNATDPHYAEWTREEFDNAGGYCFEVK